MTKCFDFPFMKSEKSVPFITR